jgi:Bifunctional DNA primase/polymerase, N-terminal
MTSPSSLAAGDLAEAALGYAQSGLAVFPCHSLADGACSCGKPGCKNAGKHPRSEHGLGDATTDTATIEAWWDRWPDANVGIRCGAASGLVALDVDVQHGGAGSLKELERRHGELPPTAETLTGGGGKHLLFLHPAVEVRNSAGKLGAGLDVRGDGGYIIAPPSVHASGRVYRWSRPLERGLAPLPTWMLEDAAAQNGKAAAHVDEIIPEGKRRDAMLAVAGKLKRSGLTGAEILPTLRELNKRCRPPLDELELESVACKSTLAVDGAAAIPTLPAVEPCSLEHVLTVFRTWLHLPDAGPVLVTLAVIAANRIESFDPLWVILVGAAGSGKTEALSATTGLDGVHVVATVTEAALLSGTPRKDTAAGASGGLLREIGASGMLVLKDFGSVLSMHRDARAAVLAALRELFDGSWTRVVGVDGGRRLHWEGRLGLLAGATATLDQHHGVMAQLGERFLLYRVSVDDAMAQGRSSLAHHGRERGMRQELAAAVAGLFEGLDLSQPPPLTETDTDRLVSLADLVSRARSPVVRDNYRREVELVPDSEAPGRVVGALARLLTGLRIIGVDDSEAWRITVKTGLDSMPAARRRALELLLGRESATTTEIAVVLGLPNSTSHRVLEDLAAHGAIRRQSQGPGKADLWLIMPWAADRYAEATSSEMSETPIHPTLLVDSI